MRKKNIFIFLIIFILTSSIVTAGAAESNLDPLCTLSRLNYIDFGVDINFEIISSAEYTGIAPLGLEEPLLRFDTVEEFELFMHDFIRLNAEMSSPYGYEVFHISELSDDGYIEISNFNITRIYRTASWWGGLDIFVGSTVSNLFVARNIEFRIPVGGIGTNTHWFAGDGEVTRSWLTGLQVGKRWEHTRGSVDFLCHPAPNFNIPGELRLTVQGVLTGGVEINGVVVGYSMNDTWTRVVWVVTW